MRFLFSIAIILALSGCVNKNYYDLSEGSLGNYVDDPDQANTYSSNLFVFDPSDLEWYAYDSTGSLVNSGKAIGGASYCPDIDEACDTPTGVYRVYRKGGPECESNTFPIEEGGGAPMPYCMFFNKGIAIHGSEYNLPNFHVSHGCVRVTYDDAYWLSNNFITVGTRVVVRPY